MKTLKPELSRQFIQEKQRSVARWKTRKREKQETYRLEIAALFLQCGQVLPKQAMQKPEVTREAALCAFTNQLTINNIVHDRIA